MTTDPIVAEVRANREAIFAECGYDLDRFNAYMREVSERLKSEGWVFADRPIVRRKPVSYEAAQPESSIVREDPPASTER
ncbi:MAG TPA: hypothetical protein DIT13_19835 [Verrucomicrobiales bacterium]|nr:hypothetical protein [Verrucomicrobiales bacterium]HRJ09239.1 hypothetical protein [Prosthecobacter sp.]HRK16250.1 hypothetical protein [Prosthecobacter sp.]